MYVYQGIRVVLPQVDGSDWKGVESDEADRMIASLATAHTTDDQG